MTVHWKFVLLLSLALERLVARARKGRDTRPFVLTRYVSWNLLRRVPLATVSKRF